MQLHVCQSCTSAYTFTDYQSQGQTIPYEVINTAKPPSGALNLSNFSHMLHTLKEPGSADHYH
ncbi:hypothetical protein EDC04DRAFT_3114069 [Pisolithus marmoratus]|nr:hypothetical protein EDC04DRAFT_3114069 [Pisolithus marmoratus]